MPTTKREFVSLHCHPQSQMPGVRGVRAAVTSVEGSLALRYELEGDLDRLRIPAVQRARAADELWRHTCFEVFIETGKSNAYLEFNFSPSHAWAAYAFRDYREGTDSTPTITPNIIVARAPGLLQLDATIPFTSLLDPGTKKIALCAVIEDIEGALSYWALRHAAGKPDFHHRDGFVLPLVIPGTIA